MRFRFWKQLSKQDGKSSLGTSVKVRSIPVPTPPPNLSILAVLLFQILFNAVSLLSVLVSFSLSFLQASVALPQLFYRGNHTPPLLGGFAFDVKSALKKKEVHLVVALPMHNFTFLLVLHYIYGATVLR